MIKDIQKEVQEITKWIKNYVEEARADRRSHSEIVEEKIVQP